jgi:hypothetical protein
MFPKYAAESFENQRFCMVIASHMYELHDAIENQFLAR